MQRLSLLAGIFLLFSYGLVQNFYPVPESYYERQGESIRFLNSEALSYIKGLGWLSPDINLPLLEANAQIFAPKDFFTRFEITVPMLTEVRSSSSTSDRVVLEVHNLDPAVLAKLSAAGIVTGSLSLDLPPLLLPLDLQLPNFLDLIATTNASRLVIESDASHYKLFTLDNPQRIVIDLFRDSQTKPKSYPLAENQSLDHGITYRRFLFPTAEKTSIVHVLNIPPHSGEFKVVGHLQGGAKLSELASGGFAALNAGYFDPNSLNSIGYLKIDYGTLSLPSRNRAVVGFSANSISIERVEAYLDIFSSQGLIYSYPLRQSDALSLHQQPRNWVGRADLGVLTVANGIILENKIGPRQVPEQGFALVYSPKIRELALLNKGDSLWYSITIEPPSIKQSQYAVEAGPLIFKDGLLVYQPELEQFQPGTRILDAITQQSVIATTHEESTLFIVAETMTAKDLIPLLESLQVKDAMRLDSGSSSSLWANKLLLNRTSERSITSAIVFIPGTSMNASP